MGIWRKKRGCGPGESGLRRSQLDEGTEVGLLCSTILIRVLRAAWESHPEVHRLATAIVKYPGVLSAHFSASSLVECLPQKHKHSLLGNVVPSAPSQPGKDGPFSVTAMATQRVRVPGK